MKIPLILFLEPLMKMSIRNYNSTKPQRRFQRSHFKQNSKPVNYTEIYKLHGVPVHNTKAVKQFNEMRESLMKKKQEVKQKKTNNQNKIKPKYTDVESIRKKNRKKICECLI